MELPTVENVLLDPEHKITYVFLAYREMTREEKVLTLRAHLAKHKRPKKGSTVKIMTALGAND